MLHESHPTANRDPQLTETASTSWGGQDREDGEAVPLNTCCIVGRGSKGGVTHCPPSLLET